VYRAGCVELAPETETGGEGGALPLEWSQKPDNRARLSRNPRKNFPKCELRHTSQPIPERCWLRVSGSGRSTHQGVTGENGAGLLVPLHRGFDGLPERSSRRYDADHLVRRASVCYGWESGGPTVLRSWMPIPHRRVIWNDMAADRLWSQITIRLGR
jgi:hypothetical protein